MQRTNSHELLSQAIEDGIGNTSTQKENVALLFVSGLFDDDEMKIETVEGKNGIEYHVKFDGHTGFAETPAKAVKNLLQDVVNGLYFAENGRP